MCSSFDKWASTTECNWARDIMCHIQKFKRFINPLLKHEEKVIRGKLIKIVPLTVLILSFFNHKLYDFKARSYSNVYVG